MQTFQAVFLRERLDGDWTAGAYCRSVPSHPLLLTAIMRLWITIMNHKEPSVEQVAFVDDRRSFFRCKADDDNRILQTKLGNFVSTAKELDTQTGTKVNVRKCCIGLSDASARTRSWTGWGTAVQVDTSRWRN